MIEAPDLATPLVGWRIWYVGADAAGPTLVSPVAPCTWPSRSAMTAACRHGCGEVPSWTCTCGLYALTDFADTVLGPGVPQVVGCVALWGRVIECVDGFRAERGYPLVLFGPVDDVERPPGDLLTARLPTRIGVVAGALDEPTLRALGRRYAVAVHHLPPGRIVPGLMSRAAARRIARWQVARARGQASDVSRRADAVRDEAARGLPARRLGDGRAGQRLTEAVEGFLTALREEPC